MHPLSALVHDFTTQFGFEPTAPSITIEVTLVDGKVITGVTPEHLNIPQVFPVYRDDMLEQGVTYRVVFFDETRAPAYFKNGEPAARDDMYRFLCDRGFTPLTRVVGEIEALMNPTYWDIEYLKTSARQASLHHLAVMGPNAGIEVGTRRFVYQPTTHHHPFPGGMVTSRQLPSREVILTDIDPNVPSTLRKLIGDILAAALNAVHAEVEPAVFAEFKRPRASKKSPDHKVREPSDIILVELAQDAVVDDCVTAIGLIENVISVKSTEERSLTVKLRSASAYNTVIKELIAVHLESKCLVSIDGESAAQEIIDVYVADESLAETLESELGILSVFTSCKRAMPNGEGELKLLYHVTCSTDAAEHACHFLDNYRRMGIISSYHIPSETRT